ncbi:unnamed protein product [Brugia timori]|uniref:HTH_48 domain-containing protein n=1 Tax=Brugia timori TaxID=42155 RepID=A0A0R3QII9_9BILA|nr:unnamed protein product [Brugia timori]
MMKMTKCKEAVMHYLHVMHLSGRKKDVFTIRKITSEWIIAIFFKALDLSPALLKKREDITPETDVREFESKKTGRGRLPKDWIETTKPVMCCYKVVQVHFKMFGFQTMVEHVLQRQYPRIFAKFNR